MNEKKVHLVFAPSLLYSPYEVLGENMWPPMGILYLSSYLRSRMANVEIKITDGCKIGYKSTLQEIKKFKPDIVGISFYTTLAYGASKLAQEVKKILPSSIVVMGGAHATTLPEDTLKASGADIVIIGEGEKTFSRIVRLISQDKNLSEFANLPGICIKIDGKVRQNAPSKFITPLDKIPFPAWDLIDIAEYKGWYMSKQSPEATMFFSRGCPYNCTFCSNRVWKSSQPVVRFRSPQNIVDEMEYLKNSFSVKEIFDNSDEFNCNLEHSLAVCREIKKRNLGITWKTQLRVSPFTEELAKELAASGCWYVHLGVESGNQETLNGIKKKIDLKDVELTCKLLKKYNIKVMALFMLFNVWEENGKLCYEDVKMTQNTLDFAWKLVKNNLADYISWSIATPYPGSELYDIACKHNLLNPVFRDSWESWQKEGLFIMDLPGVSKTDRNIIKLKGEFLRMMCLLKRKYFKLKDLPFLAKRALHILRYSAK
ncbi:MAG: B12-binding domain-containing radical SAM protein [Candidatus Aureabacteria bacterium]|nr:B12-binding domain-containing radical SAM protein [Candidatus Auribacterota bacterium]